MFNIFLSETQFQAIGAIPLAIYKINSLKLTETGFAKCFELNLIMKLTKKAANVFLGI